MREDIDLGALFRNAWRDAEDGKEISLGVVPNSLTTRTDHKYVEVTYDLDAKQFGDMKRIVHIVFGLQG